MKDNQLILSWMLGDEDGFYADFTSGKPELLSSKRLGNIRKEIFAKAISQIPNITNMFDPETLNEVLYDKRSNDSFEPLFQKAVHLITIENIELRTEAENFNFVFKNYTDPDIDEGIYKWLPYVMLYLSNVILALFDRMRPMGSGAQAAFEIRSLGGYALATGSGVENTLEGLREGFADRLVCPACRNPLRLTRHSGLRILLSETFRCPSCRKTSPFPFSWMFSDK